MKTVKAVAFALVAGLAMSAAAAPVVGELTVKSVGENYATIEIPVSDFGDGATSASVTLNYGEDAANLNKTYTPSETISEVGTATLTLRRLFPKRTYFVSVTVKNSVEQSVTSKTVSLTTAASSDAVNVPGLNQTVFTSANADSSANADWTKDYSTVPAGTDWMNDTDTNRIYRCELGAIAAYATESQKYTSEIWNDEIYWNADGLQWCYWGYMWMKKDTNYKFRAYIDDSTYIAVTDLKTATKTVLINDSSFGSKDDSPIYTPPTTGWYPIEIRLSDGIGGKGGSDNSSSYKNSVNLGYSFDGGSTWNLMIDPGDASLFSTVDSLLAITASERVADGSLTLDLAFDAGDADRTLAVVWGPQHGGETTNGWAHAEVLGTVAAGDTSYSYSMPSTWGDDDCLVLRFCFVSDDADPQWSNSTYWRDLSEPSVSDLDVDGTGGDTLVVKGSLTLPQAGTCTLTVLTGASQDALTQTWTGLDGATLSASGAFSLTLFANKGAENYLKPGETYYVAVRAVTDAASSASEVAEVAMSAAAKFDGTPNSSANRRKVTVTGNLADLGCGDAPALTLWVGEKNDEASLAKSDAVVTLSGKSYSASHTVDAFEKDYWCQIRATNTTAGATAGFEAKSALVKCHTKDTAIYTMKDGADGNWNDPACWEDNANGDCLGSPSSSSASVSFAANRKGRLVLTNNLNKAISVSGENADVTIVSAGGTQRTITSFNVTGTRAHLTLDGVKYSGGGLNFGAAIGQQATLTVTNGANLSMSPTIQNLRGGTIEVADKSTLKVLYYDFGPGTTTINDATMEVTGGIISFNGSSNTSLGTNAVFRYLGKSPLLKLSHATPWLHSQLSAVALTFEYEVPVGGYETAPFQVSNPSDGFSRKLGADDSGTVRAFLAVNVRADSPALKSAKGVTATPLISWPKAGISLDFVKEGSLPKASRDSFVWGDYLESDPTTPTTLSLTLGSRFGFLLFVR